ncbi:MAG: XRE family transcriptional regulator [Bryobacterales bacterium]|jgi:transcriptional regulator with XRE-family HTH domain|nr:XRE family transcriptional regulator [Bryobacterales bacterium]
MAVDFSEAKVSFERSESGEETIRRYLNPYELGEKIRQLRMRKKISLVDMGKHSGLSASMLSQLENGKLIPTLPTLARVAMVFDVGLDYFFGDRKKSRLLSLVRKEDRIRFPERPDHPDPSYFFECLAFSTQEKSIQAYVAEFPVRGPHAQPSYHFHAGAEFLHVTSGSVVIEFSDERYVLEEGDSVYFDPSEPHCYRGSGDGKNTAIVITTPPRM